MKFGSEMDKSKLKAVTKRNRANGNVVRKRKKAVAHLLFLHPT